MKKWTVLLLLLSMMSNLVNCGTKIENISSEMTESEENSEMSPTESTEEGSEGIPAESSMEDSQSENSENKILVVYFSRTGNTRALAEYAIQFLNADSYEIEAAVPYTDEDIAYYTNCRADREQADPTVRPEIANQLSNLEQYDLILLGYPIWHGQAPRIISTFLESYDFSGITIIPFCTSQSSGIGTSDQDLHSLCNATWKPGKRFAADGDEQAFSQWISETVPKNRNKSEENAMSKEIALMINEKMIPVIWEENSSVEELLNKVSDEPIHINMSMYGGWEQVGSLGQSITRNDVQLTAHNGDIMLYSGNQIVLFYGDNTWAYTKLGHIDLPEAEITAMLSSEDVSITLAVQ